MSLWSRVRDFVGFNDPVDGLTDYSDLEAPNDYQDLYAGRQSGQAGSPTVGFETEEDPEADFASQSGISTSRRRQRVGDWPEGGNRRTTRERTSGNGGSMGSNVIGLPSVSHPTTEVVVIEPRSFDEMAQVVQHLRDRKTVIMNLTLMDPADAQRSVDFVAGGTYAIDGHQERIGENIFLFTPSTVMVSTPSSQPVQPPLQRSMQSPTPIWSGSYADSMPAVGQR